MRVTERTIREQCEAEEALRDPQWLQSFAERIATFVRMRPSYVDHEDVLQDAIVYAIEFGLHYWQLATPNKPWLEWLTYTTRRALDSRYTVIIRRERRHNADSALCEARDPSAFSDTRPKDAKEFFHLATLLQWCQYVEACHGLPSEAEVKPFLSLGEFKVFRLWRQGKELGEIAELLRKTPNNCYQYLHIARQKIRAHFEPIILEREDI